MVSFSLFLVSFIVSSSGMMSMTPPNPTPSPTSMRRLENNQLTDLINQHSENVITKEHCELMATELGSPFSTQNRLKGAPAGCILHNDGRVIFVKKCRNHENCGTSTCKKCSVLDIASFLTSEERCSDIASELGVHYSAVHKWNGAPAGCIRVNDGRVMYVRTCHDHPFCGTSRCNRCTMIPVTSEERCLVQADILGLPFSTQHESEGAPAGCMRYDDGRVVYVKTCTDHVNCGTSNCNGCAVLDVTSGRVLN